MYGILSVGRLMSGWTGGEAGPAPTGNALVWGTANYIIWGSGNNLIWGTS